MSVHDLSEDVSQQLDRGKQSSSLENVIGAEGNQPLELQSNADKEDGALGLLDANHSRTRRTRSLTEKGRRYQADILLEKRKRAISRMQRKAKAIDDLLYSAGNQVAVREELDQYSDLFKLVTNHHEEYCELLDAENQQQEEGWFDDLDQDVFNFKHRIHSWLKEATQRSSKGSRCSSSSKRSNSSRSSSSNKSSGSSRSSTKLKLLEERARIAELETEVTLMMEQQKAETQAKMFQLQREVVRAKARAQVYAGYTKDDETKTDITETEHKDEVTLSRHQRNSKHSQPHSCMKVTDTSQPNNKGDDRVKKSMKQKNSAASNLRALKDDGADSEMAQMMSKLLRQQAASEVNIDVFTGDPNEYHYFLAVFEEVVEKKIDDARGRLTRLIKYTGGEPKEMIKHCIQQPANIGYKNARSLLEQKYGNPHSIIAAYRREIKT